MGLTFVSLLNFNYFQAHIIEIQMYFPDFLEQSKVVKAWDAITTARPLSYIVVLCPVVTAADSSAFA